MLGEYSCNYLLRTGKSVGGPAISLKDALNIGKLYSAFPVRFVVSRLALNLVFIENMLMGIM